MDAQAVGDPGQVGILGGQHVGLLVVEELDAVLDLAQEHVGLAELHLARSNPIARASLPTPALIAVSGPDAYISPDWYGPHEQVPRVEAGEAAEVYAEAARQDRGQERAHPLSAGLQIGATEARYLFVFKDAKGKLRHYWTVKIPLKSTSETGVLIGLSTLKLR